MLRPAVRVPTASTEESQSWECRTSQASKPMVVLVKLHTQPARQTDGRQTLQCTYTARTTSQANQWQCQSNNAHTSRQTKQWQTYRYLHTQTSNYLPTIYFKILSNNDLHTQAKHLQNIHLFCPSRNLCIENNATELNMESVKPAYVNIGLLIACCA